MKACALSTAILTTGYVCYKVSMGSFLTVLAVTLYMYVVSVNFLEGSTANPNISEFATSAAEHVFCLGRA